MICNPVSAAGAVPAFVTVSTLAAEVVPGLTTGELKSSTLALADSFGASLSEALPLKVMSPGRVPVLATCRLARCVPTDVGLNFTVTVQVAFTASAWPSLQVLPASSA